MLKTLTKSEVALAVARLYVRLAADDLTQALLANVDAARVSLADTVNPLTSHIDAIWTNASNAALDHIKIVMANNPKIPIEQILNRPDVQQALALPFVLAGQHTTDAIKSAWHAGAGIGNSHAAADLAAIGLPDVGGSDVSTEVLDRLVQDAVDNASAARQRLVDAITGAKQGAVLADMQKALDDLRRRATMGVDSAGSMASTQAQLARYEAAQKATGQSIRLMWVTHFRPTTCPTCAALHGRTIPLGGTFSDDMTFAGKAPKTYVPLAGPPRHPNCGCRVVAYVSLAGTKTKPGDLQDFAQDWWDKEGTP